MTIIQNYKLIYYNIILLVYVFDYADHNHHCYRLKWCKTKTPTLKINVEDKF